MKRKIGIPLVVLLLLFAPTSCSRFTFAEPTPEPDPIYFAPSTPLKFEPDAMPTAMVDAAYEIEIRITENVTPAGDISISNGSLPPGLELVKVEGEDVAKISGVPKESGTFTFTVNVWCYGTMAFGQSGEKEYTIVVDK